MRIAVIIPAAGSGTRYAQSGGLRSKLDEDLGGKPVLQRTVEVFTKFDAPDATVAAIIVAGPHDPEAFAEFKERHGDRLGLLGAVLCRGGATHRWETVQAALALVPADCTHIAVHDAARPCFGPELLDRVFRAAGRHHAAIPAVEVVDSLKRVVQTDEALDEPDAAAAILGLSPADGPRLRYVGGQVDRAGLVMVQTPQVFSREVLLAAYEDGNIAAASKAGPITDDAGLVERLGRRVVVVEGDSRNIKITRAADLDLARQIMGVRAPEGRPAHKRF